MDKSKNYTVAREPDGTIQIVFTIPKEDIARNENKVLEEIGKDLEISGFRKGNAPLEKVKQNISREKLAENVLKEILPEMYSNALVSENIKPSIYPKFELISSNDNEDWQVRALVCEIPSFELNDYKTKLKGINTSSTIWTPEDEKDDNKDKKMSRQQKEEKILELLLKEINPIVPKILIDEEVNSRLSQLLQRIEKLGLTLEGYLSSLGKTPETLREEYKKQSEEAIKIELILEKIALSEKLDVNEEEIETAINASSADPKLRTNLESQKIMIKTILLRRKALDFLTALL